MNNNDSDMILNLSNAMTGEQFINNFITPSTKTGKLVLNIIDEIKYNCPKDISTDIFDCKDQCYYCWEYYLKSKGFLFKSSIGLSEIISNISYNVVNKYLKNGHTLICVIKDKGYLVWEEDNNIITNKDIIIDINNKDNTWFKIDNFKG